MFGPPGIGRVEVFETGDQVDAVEFPIVQVAYQRDDPDPAENPAHVTHGILPFQSGPVRKGRSVEHQGAGDVRPVRAKQRHRPSSLAVADHHGFLGLGMATDDFLDKLDLGMLDIIIELSRAGFGIKRDEIDRVPGFHGHTDLGILLGPADSGTMTGPGDR